LTGVAVDAVVEVVVAYNYHPSSSIGVVVVAAAVVDDEVVVT
jgi:hypothetical protein